MSPASPNAADRRRWLALGVVCMAQLMIVLDSTIVNVALPSIQHDLHFTQGNLTWVINAFLVTFGSFLLLAGRLSDLFGRKRVFMVGMTVFTVASILCGIAPDAGFLIVARFIQGIGAAMQASVILAIIVTQFPGADERGRAMSAYVFTAVAGGSLGLLAGGVLTQALSWHWIFFVNVPIGIATLAAARVLIDPDRGSGIVGRIDWLGSALVTFSLMLFVYAIVEATAHGWGSSQVLGFGAVAIALMAAFLTVEARVSNPIMPLRILRLRGLMGASAARAFLVTGMYSTFFLGTLYLEHVRHLTAIQTGLAYMPWTLTVAALSSLGVTRRLVARFGALPTLSGGMVSAAIGLFLMTTITTTTAFFPTVFFAFFLIGLGIGNAFTPLMTLAMADVPMQDAGIGSGITTLSQQVGGAIGMAALSTIATNHTKGLVTHGIASARALVDGYQLAFAVGVGAILVGLIVALVVLRSSGGEPPVIIERDEDEAAEAAAAEGVPVIEGVVAQSAAGTDSDDPVIWRLVLPIRAGRIDAPRRASREHVTV